MDAREKIINVAKSYIGTCGGSVAHSDIIHIFNTVKPYGYTAHVKDPWCAEFVSACAIQAFGKKAAKDNFPLSAACTFIIKKAKEMKIWKESDSFIPNKGDWILYDWDDSGKGDNKNTPDHVGIVEAVSGGYITVIEGNYSNKVKRRKIAINGKYIRGFVIPHYENIKVKGSDKSIDELVKECLEGKWGNGSARKMAMINSGYDYAAVQNKINKVLKLTDEVLAGKYGNGIARKMALGNDYDLVQWNINRIEKGKRS